LKFATESENAVEPPNEDLTSDDHGLSLIQYHKRYYVLNYYKFFLT